MNGKMKKMNIDTELTKDQVNTIMALIRYFEDINSECHSEVDLVDAMNSIKFVYAKFVGISGIFTEEKISNDILKSLPDFIYHYDIRHDDEGFGIPCTLENHVVVNRLGTFLTFEKIKFDNSDNYIDVSSDYEVTTNFINFSSWVSFELSKNTENLFDAYVNAKDKESNDNKNLEETDMKVNVLKTKKESTPDNKVILYMPYYFIDDGQIFSNLESVIVNNNDKNIEVSIEIYSLLWCKGWTTLTNPNNNLLEQPINFGKCNESEINLIKDAAKKAGLIVSIETEVIKHHPESELEALEVSVEFDSNKIVDDDKNSIEPSFERFKAYKIKAYKTFAMLLKTNDNPYHYDKKGDIFTYRYKDGYTYSTKDSKCDKKFELLEGVKDEQTDRVMYRIKALKDFRAINGKYIKKGDIGGWVESESNLSQEGNCWIADDAKVYDNAIVMNNAIICGNSEAFGHAVIRANSEIFGSTKIYGHTMTSGNVVINSDDLVISLPIEITSDAYITNKSHLFTAMRFNDNSITFFRNKKFGISVNYYGLYTGPIEDFERYIGCGFIDNQTDKNEYDYCINAIKMAKAVISKD